MTKILALILAFISTQANSEGFNFAAYQTASVSEITTRWNGITNGYEPGLSIKSPEKIAVTLIAIGTPFQCNNEPLKWVFNSLRMPDLLKQTPTNHCIKVKIGETSPAFYAFIQDGLVPSYVAEIKPNSSVKLFAGFLAYSVSKDPSTNFPLLSVNEFQAL